MEVFRTLLREVPADRLARVHGVLQAAGIDVAPNGRLSLQVAGPVPLAELPLHVLDDAAALREHVERLSYASVEDPPLAISGARALVEATCKRILIELGEVVDENATVPALVKQVNRVMDLDPAAVAPTEPGRDTIVRLLGQLGAIPQGLAELRDAYGPDHGRSTAASAGWRPRDADLAVGAAATYVSFVLATIDGRRSRAATTPR